MTNASGIQNLLKNIGGAIGTSLVATMLTRYAQIHQFMLVRNLTELNPNYIERVQATAGALSQYVHSSVADRILRYTDSQFIGSVAGCRRCLYRIDNPAVPLLQ